jgi:pilus assembly protein CpaB
MNVKGIQNMGRRIIAIAAAVLLAIVGVVAVVLYANGADQRAVAAAQPRTVFVSQSAVPSGTTLNDAVANGLIVQTTLPAKSVPAGALTAVTDDNKNLLAVTDIAPGEYIQTARFGTTPQSSAAIQVPSGQLAVSLVLSEQAKVGTFVTPGSHIVIYDTVAGATTGPTGGAAPASAGTHVLFDDVLVIAIGNAALTPVNRPTGQATAAPASGTLVTLALTPEQAPRLVHALSIGTLYAGLRGADVKIDTALVVSDANVFNR